MREAAMPPKFTARFVNSLTSSEINFTKILRAASMGADQGSSKRQSSHQCLFALLGSAHKKPARKVLVKLTPELQELIPSVIKVWEILKNYISYY